MIVFSLDIDLNKKKEENNHCKRCGHLITNKELIEIIVNDIFRGGKKNEK